MTSLFLSPHNDDETLFGAYTLLREKPFVVIVYQSARQAFLPAGVTATEREAETREAMAVLGCRWEQWSGSPDTGLHEDAVRLAIASFDRLGFDRVYAPAVEEGGHEQHNLVGELALKIFGDRVRSYLTYTRHGGRTIGDPLDQVVYHPEWVAAKLRAMSCYESQMREPSCLPWFLTPDLREWYA